MKLDFSDKYHKYQIVSVAGNDCDPDCKQLDFHVGHDSYDDEYDCKCSLFKKDLDTYFVDSEDSEDSEDKEPIAIRCINCLLKEHGINKNFSAIKEILKKNKECIAINTKIVKTIESEIRLKNKNLESKMDELKKLEDNNNEILKCCVEFIDKNLGELK